MAIKYSVAIIIILATIASVGLWLIPVRGLEASSLSEPRIGPPACLAPRSMTVFGGGFLRFQVPNNVRVAVDRAADATQLSIDGPSKGSRLTISEGVDDARNWRDADRFGSQESDRQIRQTNHEGLIMLDVRVRKSDATRSRLIGIVFQTAYYESASEADAAFFDQIMDSACFWYPFDFPNSLIALAPYR